LFTEKGERWGEEEEDGDTREEMGEGKGLRGAAVGIKREGAGEVVVGAMVVTHRA
jgi:hypothetical protein